MQMTALSRYAVGPLGHERRHQATALREHLGKSLEECGAVGGFEGIAIGQSRLENSGPGLSVQALDRKSHDPAEIEKLVVEIRVHGTAQHRVAKCSGGHGLQVS